MLVCLHKQNLCSSEWILFIINVLNDCGLSNIMAKLMQHEVDPEWMKREVEQDQFLQKWSKSIKESSKCKLYYDIKTSSEFENYPNKIPFKYRKALIRFRTSNHNLTVEKGRHLWIGRSRNERIVQLCQSDSVGDNSTIYVQNLRNKERNILIQHTFQSMLLI